MIPANNTEFHIRKIIVPDLALVRFMVYEQKEAGGKQLLGQRTIPFKHLQNGYRHIMLRSVANKTIGLPSIFVKIDLKTYVPDDMMSIVDMLQNPRSHLTAVQKRTHALKEMGCVDEEDLEGVKKEDLILEPARSSAKSHHAQPGAQPQKSSFVVPGIQVEDVVVKEKSEMNVHSLAAANLGENDPKKLLEKLTFPDFKKSEEYSGAQKSVVCD